MCGWARGVRLTRCVVTSGVSIPDGFTAESQVIEPADAGGLRLTPIARRTLKADP